MWITESEVQNILHSEIVMVYPVVCVALAFDWPRILEDTPGGIVRWVICTEGVICAGFDWERERVTFTA